MNLAPAESRIYAERIKKMGLTHLNHKIKDNGRYELCSILVDEFILCIDFSAQPRKSY
jgi:hypothetical protein